MVTPDEAEALAQQAMQDYVAKCGCNSTEEVGNALMKLVSMCGFGMCATVGKPDAVARLEGTAAYIAKTQEGRHWKMQRAN